MDEYGQIGPEKPHWAADIKKLTGELAGGETVFVTIAHRMTAQALILSLARDVTTPFGNPTGLGRHWREAEPPWIFVTVLERGAAAFMLDTQQEPGYIASHLSKLDYNFVDSETLAMLLEAIAAEWKLRL